MLLGSLLYSYGSSRAADIWGGLLELLDMVLSDIWLYEFVYKFYNYDEESFDNLA